MGENGGCTSKGSTSLSILNAALNLVLVGPMEDRSTYVAVRGADGIDLSRKSRNYQDSDHIRRWLATQALDWVRRGLLGQLTSPAD